MIIQEERMMNGTMFCVNKSDKGVMIIKDGDKHSYSEAWDVLPCNHEYRETEDMINKTINSSEGKVFILKSDYEKENTLKNMILPLNERFVSDRTTEISADDKSLYVEVDAS